MTNLLPSEWTEILQAVAKSIRLRFPGLDVAVEETELRVETEICAGTISLRPVRDSKRNHAAPVARVGKGAALSGTLAEIEIGIQDYRIVADALHRGAALTHRYRVWYGDCPCDRCGERGELTHGTVCEACDGTGVRTEPQAD